MKNTSLKYNGYHWLKVVLIIGLILLFTVGPLDTVNKASVSDSNCGGSSTLSITWDATLNFNEPGSANTNAVFGEAPDANDGPPVDIYDKMLPPPPPSPPYIRSWFNDSLPNPYDKLWTDYRYYPDTSKVWNLTVQWVPADYSTSTNITISWNINDIDSSEYDSVILCDCTNDICIKMTESSTYKALYSNEAMTLYYFQIKAIGGPEENNSPIADFTYLPLFPTTDDTIQFTDESTDVDGTIVSWLWDFGDGNPSIEQNPTHQFITKGVFNVSLTVEDNDGATDIETTSVEITVPDTGGDPDGGDPGEGPPGGGGTPPSTPTNQNLIANASAGEPYTGVTGEEIIFDGSLSNDTDGNITMWDWDFGDGTNGSGEIVTHVYSTVDTFTIILTVIDDDGNTDSYETIAIISQPNIPPTVPEKISGETEGNKNTEYNYIFLSTNNDNDTIKYSVDWGDGTTDESDFLPNGTAFEADHSWTSAGKYIVTVIADDNLTSTSTEMMVMIDAIDAGDIGYITDGDGDGTYDTFHSLGLETDLGQENGKYLIDSNGDGEWDYFFDLAEGLSLYQEEEQVKTPGFEIVIVLSALLLVFLFKILWKRKR